MKIDQEISDEQAFSSVYKLLNVATSSVTFPLLSFTILSTLSGLIKLNNKMKPEFILNLYGDNGQTKEVLSNLFCNLYNRSKHIHSIDSRIHANQSLKSEIHGRKVGVIGPHNDVDLINRSIHVFRSHCTLESGSESHMNNDITVLLMTDSLKFIHAIDQLLMHETLFAYSNKSIEDRFQAIENN
ncbi:hypothetical protein MHI12_09590 [Paenibacillus sp. FSL H8-0280]|uniref:hypothetical protein n=1 Tax=Paenibacillus sp. FSL H8-0280 TaxID=2921382 RepID=UPI0032532A64